MLARPLEFNINGSKLREEIQYLKQQISSSSLASNKMQAVKEKIQDMKDMRKAKAEAKAEEKAEQEVAKARMEVAKEVRLAREAQAEMQLHVAKAGEKAVIQTPVDAAAAEATTTTTRTTTTKKTT